ncbi:Dual specificity protein phosphatase 12 [Apodemus speciosus]|uniref:protein-tyrosine-phosphatase n=1 Tax=Apodemus speciosus TaxID=105296 RepID=A0ABQ0EFG8_APOSI
MLEVQGSNHGCERQAPTPSPASSAGHAVEVRPGLYLGGAAAVAEPGRLREAGITAVLTVDSEPALPAGAGFEGLRSLFVPALDKPETDLLSHLDRCVAFIGQARSEGRAVLVHWCLFFSHAGVSRSVAVVTAFIMKTDQLTFEKAYENLQTVKPEARMNEGFEWQLKLYEAMGYEVDTCSAIYKQYRLQKVTEKYPELQNLPQELFAVDPTTISQGLKDDILYKCRKCRRSLFRRSSILGHSEGSGPTASLTRNQHHLLSSPQGVRLSARLTLLNPCSGWNLRCWESWMGRWLLTSPQFHKSNFLRDRVVNLLTPDSFSEPPPSTSCLC